MNSALVQLERFLREADPATARTVERIVLNVLALRSPKGDTPQATSPVYRLPSRRLGAHAGLDLTRLAHAEEEL